MWSQLKHQALLLLGSLMAFAASIALGCTSGNCYVNWVSVAGLYLLLSAIGKRRWPIPLTMLTLGILLRSCRGPLPDCGFLPVCLPCQG